MSRSMFTQNGEWDIIIMFNQSGLKKGKQMKANYRESLGRFAAKLGSARFGLFVLLMAAAVIPMGMALGITYYYLNTNMIRNEINSLQTSSAVMAGVFSEYVTFAEAERAGAYAQIRTYSTVNSFRIRIVDDNFLVIQDSYYIDMDKSVLSERAINTFISGKSISEYDRTTGTLESVAPIRNVAGRILGVVIVDKDISEVDRFISSIMDQETAALAALLVIVTALIVVWCRFSGKSIMAALKTVENVADGHRDQRVEAKGCTELRDFAKDFNTILDKANDVDENRQEFVSNVSHELKTPITSIKVLADSLNMQEEVPIEIYKEFMQDITSEIDRESKIIDDLLSLVKMDKGAGQINIASVNLNELMEITLKRLKPLAQKKNIEVLFESFRPVVAEVDEVKFTQVISNLVENAIKYNTLDGWVHVSLNADYQYFYVRIEDSGIGIPKESQDKVFDRFYRVDKARSRETGGTGLGLAIVQKIIFMHHGTIKLHSEEGDGTTFTVRIPLNYVG